MNEQQKTALDRLAARLASDPFFLASALAAYQQRHGFDDAGLAAQFGCPVVTLTNLRLCRRPDGEELQEGAHRIAERFGLDAAALVRVVEEMEGGAWHRQGRLRDFCLTGLVRRGSILVLRQPNSGLCLVPRRRSAGLLGVCSGGARRLGHCGRS
jgi:hypothetical protein